MIERQQRRNGEQIYTPKAYLAKTFVAQGLEFAVLKAHRVPKQHPFNFSSNPNSLPFIPSDAAIPGAKKKEYSNMNSLYIFNK